MTSSATLSGDPWLLLPETEWDEAAARHLLRRIGWSATPAAVDSAQRDGLSATLERAFPRKPIIPEESAELRELKGYAREMRAKLRRTDKAKRRELARENREHLRNALRSMSVDWLQYAARPEHSAFEKWTLFLSDIYVVASQKVKNPLLISDHFNIIREHALGSAPRLTKAISRSPAMILYLDLQQNKREAPNENFARELFELFTLGEGNYTEQDIKTAARAFTGYRQRDGVFQLQRRQQDTSSKTIFGHTGRFDGDDVIDLAYQLPAAEHFLPREMARFYLTDDDLPEKELADLGDWWRQDGYDLRKLALRFFGSRLFFHSSYRENYLKSPAQFYLGLIQDLQLDVTPLNRYCLAPLKLMGQELFNPPNVRGWVGGRRWINSATLQTRRQLIQALFSPLNEDRLNADDRRILDQFRKDGHTRFTTESIDPKTYFTSNNPEMAARYVVDNFLPGSVSSKFYQEVVAALPSSPSNPRQWQTWSRVLETLLQSPAYQLC